MVSSANAQLFANLGPVAQAQFAIENILVEADVNDGQRTFDAVVALQNRPPFFWQLKSGRCSDWYIYTFPSI